MRIDREHAHIFKNVTDWKRQCAAVVPCFNEAAHIDAVIAGIQKHLPKVIVVDDGSTDATAEKAKKAGAEVVCRSMNCGKGAALRAGWQRASELGFTWALILDGDGQHKPDDIPAFIQSAEQTGAALLVGNRMHSAQVIPWLRRIVNRWMSRQLSRRAGMALPDTQCGFRLLNLKAWAALRLKTEHYEVESETLMAFLAAAHRVEFVPIQVVGRSTHSHIRPLTDTWRWWRWWLSLPQPEKFS